MTRTMSHPSRTGKERRLLTESTWRSQFRLKEGVIATELLSEQIPRNNSKKHSSPRLIFGKHSCLEAHLNASCSSTPRMRRLLWHRIASTKRLLKILFNIMLKFNFMSTKTLILMMKVERTKWRSPKMNKTRTKTMRKKKTNPKNKRKRPLKHRRLGKLVRLRRWMVPRRPPKYSSITTPSQKTSRTNESIWSLFMPI